MNFCKNIQSIFWFDNVTKNIFKDPRLRGKWKPRKNFANSPHKHKRSPSKTTSTFAFISLIILLRSIITRPACASIILGLLTLAATYVRIPREYMRQLAGIQRLKTTTTRPAIDILFATGRHTAALLYILYRDCARAKTRANADEITTDLVQRKMLKSKEIIKCEIIAWKRKNWCVYHCFKMLEERFKNVVRTLHVFFWVMFQNSK